MSQPAHPLLPGVETLISQHYAAILRLAGAILNDPAEAEDAAQETFIRAAAHLEEYRANAGVKTWLYAIAINVCRGELRKRKTRQALSAALHAIQAIAARPPSPEESALQSETHHRLWAAVDRLDDKHRLPVLLHYVEGLPVAEIAEVLSASQGTVHSRLHYAREKLAQALGSGKLAGARQEGAPTGTGPEEVNL